MDNKKVKWEYYFMTERISNQNSILLWRNNKIMFRQNSNYSYSLNDMIMDFREFGQHKLLEALYGSL